MASASAHLRFRYPFELLSGPARTFEVVLALDTDLLDDMERLFQAYLDPEK